jgi:hypothetical protein
MFSRPPLLFAVAVVLMAGWGSSVAAAAPPANDAPVTPGAFSPYTTVNGMPREQQAIAELFESTPDPGVPLCFGPGSFARTVWYRVPEAPVAQELTVEATGRTLDPIDLAAFVQPELLPPPAPPPAVTTTVANVCAGIEDGGASAAEEPASAITLRVPANHALLLQVGRRGRMSSADDERVVLSLAADPPAGLDPLVGLIPPLGDRADAATPFASGKRPTSIELAQSTITGEDPAQPACPSMGTVWRRLVPGSRGRRLVSVAGRAATTLAVFAGRTPTSANALDCVNRERSGRLEMMVRTRKRQPLWIRIGSDRLAAAPALLGVEPGAGATVIDGGPGGFDPSPGGPGRGFPGGCQRGQIERGRITGPPLTGFARQLNGSVRVPLRIVVRGASVCDAQLRLYGPRGRIYAQGRAVRLKGPELVFLSRWRSFRPGVYRLRVSGVSRLGMRESVRTRVGGRLR